MTAHIPRGLHWERQGRHGPPMLFIHGNPYDHRAWLYQMAHFSADFTTVAVDLPGYGRSGAAEPGMTLADMGEACWEALHETSRDPAILVGNSVGASIAIQMTGQRRRQVRALVLTGCAYMPNRDFARMGGKAWDERGVEARRESMERFTSPGRRNDAQAQYLARLFLDTNDRLDPKAVRRIFTALEEPEPEALYDAIDVPCLIVAGTEDVSFPGAQALAKRIPGAELVTVPGGGHVCMLDYPEAWDVRVTAFLEKHGLY